MKPFLLALVIAIASGAAHQPAMASGIVPEPASKPGLVSPGNARASPPSKPREALTERATKLGDPADTGHCPLPHAVYTQAPPIDPGDGCGFENVVVLSELRPEDGAPVGLPGPVTVTCGFAQTVSAWVIEDVAPAARTHLGTDLAGIVTGPGYQCRRRNNQPDGKLSEHALGKAVDISAFQLADGAVLSVGDNWKEETPSGRFLRAVHKAACARFTTVLGPDADPAHAAHFHLDTGCHGVSCTYVICQ